MKHFYKITIFSLALGFATGSFAETSNPETTESETIIQTVSERKSCDDIATEIAELSTIADPDEETLKTLDELKQKQRSICNKNAGSRSIQTTTSMRARGPQSPSRIRPTEETTEPESENLTTDLETETISIDISDSDLPQSETPAITETQPDTLPISEFPDTETTVALDQISGNITSGLCSDGSAPNKYGCCGNEIFKEVENLTFACCLPDGGDCFPPIK